jgi:acyl-coenzyme A synthetase/AMP-(fatty) acid ligase
MISHRASLTFVNWAFDCFRVQPTDRVSNHAPLHFDLSIFDIFVAVKAGASIVLVPDELSVFPIDLANFIEGEGITVWYSVPSALTRLVLYGELGRHQFSSLRQVLFAGEVFPIKYLRLLRAAIPHATYYNLYGPTETNVCTYYRVGEIAPERTEPIPIGTACANTEVFAVTDRLEVASLGEVGELYVRGPSLMKGYWGMPERTAEVLFPNPWRDAVWGDTVYRTGDLVRQNEAGNYVFLGRRDNLIKSRGYRIELGEIETVLYRHPEIEEAAAIAIPDEEIGNAIRAVVVPRDASRLTAGELQALCAERLPKYMIPAEFEFRASLPRTSTGKVDKWSLVREQLEGKEASSSPGAAVDPA